MASCSTETCSKGGSFVQQSLKYCGATPPYISTAKCLPQIFLLIYIIKATQQKHRCIQDYFVKRG